MSSQKSTRDQLTRHNLGLIPNEKFNTNPKLLVWIICNNQKIIWKCFITHARLFSAGGNIWGVTVCRSKQCEVTLFGRSTPHRFSGTWPPRDKRWMNTPSLVLAWKHSVVVLRLIGLVSWTHPALTRSPSSLILVEHSSAWYSLHRLSFPSSWFHSSRCGERVCLPRWLYFSFAATFHMVGWRDCTRPFFRSSLEFLAVAHTRVPTGVSLPKTLASIARY